MFRLAHVWLLAGAIAASVSFVALERLSFASDRTSAVRRVRRVPGLYRALPRRSFTARCASGLEMRVHHHLERATGERATAIEMVGGGSSADVTSFYHADRRTLVVDWLTLRSIPELLPHFEVAGRQLPEMLPGEGMVSSALFILLAARNAGIEPRGLERILFADVFDQRTVLLMAGERHRFETGTGGTAGPDDVSRFAERTETVALGAAVAAQLELRVSGVRAYYDTKVEGAPETVTLRELVPKATHTVNALVRSYWGAKARLRHLYNVPVPDGLQLELLLQAD